MSGPAPQADSLGSATGRLQKYPGSVLASVLVCRFVKLSLIASSVAHVQSVMLLWRVSKAVAAVHSLVESSSSPMISYA